MAMVDVTVALTNPYTMSKFDIYRRTQVVNDFGETKVTDEITAGVFGLVYPEGDSSLSREPNMASAPKNIAVICRQALRGESKTIGDATAYQPDIILWRGNTYIVGRIDDYSNYGPGFVSASCQMTDSLATAPTTREL